MSTKLIPSNVYFHPYKGPCMEDGKDRFKDMPACTKCNEPYMSNCHWRTIRKGK